MQGSTLHFNQTITEADIAAQQAADPSAAQSEWQGGFREDIATFLDDALIDAAVEYGRPLELTPGGRVESFGAANFSDLRRHSFALPPRSIPTALTEPRT